MTLHELNSLSPENAFRELQKCCGSSAWLNKMVLSRPFADNEQLIVTAEKSWQECSDEDALEAFSHHPKIGNVKELADKFASTRHWAGNEQGAVKQADEKVLADLAEGNEAYEKKFGYIFIVCATGKTAEGMLEILQQRLPNKPEDEMKIARAEQMKITILRLNKLISL